MALTPKDTEVIKALMAEQLRTSQPVAPNSLSLSLGKARNLPGVLQALMVGLSTILLVVMGIVGYIQFSKPDVAKAAAGTPYTETWTGIDTIYSYISRTPAFRSINVYGSGMPATTNPAAPPSGTFCAGENGATYGFGSCNVTVTKWSVTGTVGP